MANHRMFSNRIANSARFLQMPAESQVLYFHMVLRADDDGVVEAYPLIALLSTPPDAFKVLCVKGFIKQLNDDQVMLIEDWLEHNTIRADRKVDSIYKSLVLEKCPEIMLIEPKLRSDVKNNKRLLTAGQSTDSPRTAEVKLSKAKIREVNSLPSDDGEPTYDYSDPEMEAIKPVVKEPKVKSDEAQLIDYYVSAYKKSYGYPPAVSARQRYLRQSKPFIEQYGLDEMKRMCDEYFVNGNKLFEENKCSLGMFLSDFAINLLK